MGVPLNPTIVWVLLIFGIYMYVLTSTLFDGINQHLLISLKMSTENLPEILDKIWLYNFYLIRIVDVFEISKYKENKSMQV